MSAEYVCDRCPKIVNDGEGRYLEDGSGDRVCASCSVPPEPIADRQALDDIIEAAKSASDTMTAPLFWNANMEPVYLGFESEAEAERFEANIERMIARLEALFDQHGQI